MLLGLIRPNAGEVRLFGVLISEVTRRLLGAARNLIDLALDTVKLTKDADRRVREYSLGMRQRLGLWAGFFLTLQANSASFPRIGGSRKRSELSNLSSPEYNLTHYDEIYFYSTTS